MKHSILARLGAVWLALVSLASSASATWSICVVNRRTGEVAIASATCNPGQNLLLGLPDVRVGVGVGAIQSAGWAPGLVIIHDLLPTGAPPQEILDAVLAAAPGPSSLQIGIASMHGPPATFTGSMSTKVRGGVTGEVGDLSYAIQGNVLTGKGVWLEAEAALLNTPGDLGQRVMAAMEAAMVLGGDRRCSCPGSTSCGAPPPSFEKSAHVGFVIVARMGDPDPVCRTGTDCANRPFYLRINVARDEGSVESPDPVLQLREKYDTWRAGRVGRPDGILSSVDPVPSLPADGVTERTVRVTLRDIDGARLTSGGDDLLVEPMGGGSSATVGTVVDHGDGTYSFPLRAGTRAGTDTFVLTARSVGPTRATLFPYLEVRTDPLTPLHAGLEEVSLAAGGAVPLTLNVPERPGGRYLVLGSLSGTSPGVRWGGASVPLNPDPVTLLTLLRAGDPALLPGTQGVLDAGGRGEGAVLFGSAPPLAAAGIRLDWVGLVVGRGKPVVTNAVGFDVRP